MDRRQFVVGAFALVAAPRAAEAQQAKIARIGYLQRDNDDPAASSNPREAFLQALRDLGYVEGRNLVIEYRSGEGKIERLPALAAELVALKIDVIVAPSTVAAHGTRPARIIGWSSARTSRIRRALGRPMT